ASAGRGSRAGRSTSAKCLPTCRRVVPCTRVSATACSQSRRKRFWASRLAERRPFRGVSWTWPAPRSALALGRGGLGRGGGVAVEAVLVLKAGEAAALQGVVLDVADAALDFALVTGGIRPRGQEHGAVVGGERADLGVELGIEPVGPRHGGLEVVEDQLPGHP